jgi:hypothetical protein
VNTAYQRNRDIHSAVHSQWLEQPLSNAFGIRQAAFLLQDKSGKVEAEVRIRITFANWVTQTRRVHLPMLCENCFTMLRQDGLLAWARKLPSKRRHEGSVSGGGPSLLGIAHGFLIT